MASPSSSPLSPHAPGPAVILHCNRALAAVIDGHQQRLPARHLHWPGWDIARRTAIEA
jgi:hypothetical protein